MDAHLVRDPASQLQRSRRAAERHAVLAALGAVDAVPTARRGAVPRLRHTLAARLRATAALIDVG